MRMRCASRLSIVILLAVAASAAGQDMPKPAPELSQIAYFEGTWSCAGKMLATPMGPAGTMTSTVDARKDLNGFWQTGTITSTAADMPFEGRFYVTYNTAAKQFEMFWADSMGGAARSTSAGWKGDTLTYEGDMHMAGQSMKARDIFTRSGPGAMKHVSEIQMNGKWMTTFEESCKKK